MSKLCKPTIVINNNVYTVALENGVEENATLSTLIDKILLDNTVRNQIYNILNQNISPSEVTNFNELVHIIPGNSKLKEISDFLVSTGRIYLPVITSIKAAISTIYLFGLPKLLWLDGDILVNGASIKNIILSSDSRDLLIIKSHKLEDINNTLLEYIYKVILENNGEELYDIIRGTWVQKLYDEYAKNNPEASKLNSKTIFDLLLYDDTFNSLIDNPKSSIDKKLAKTMRNHLFSKILEMLVNKNITNTEFLKLKDESDENYLATIGLKLNPEGKGFILLTPVGSIQFDGSEKGLVKALLDIKYKISKIPSMTDEFVKELENLVHIIFEKNPEIEKVGSEKDYLNYILGLFPESVEKSIYWHGSNTDLSNGFQEGEKVSNTNAPETKGRNDVYAAAQPWTVLLYVKGVNVKEGIKRKNTRTKQFEIPNWNNLWWELKEIMSNGRRENDDWKDIVIGENSVRLEIPNKKGELDSPGTPNGHGTTLRKRKSDYGYENKSDREFFEEVLGVRWGEDTFNTWTERNAEIFKGLQSLENPKLTDNKGGSFPVVVDVRNPIQESGQDTYYEEHRQLFSTADINGNDAIISKNADNEFGSDVIVMLNYSGSPETNERIHFLGTASDLAAFKRWKEGDKVTYLEKNREDIEKLAKTILTGEDSLGNKLLSPKEEIDKQLEQLLMCN